MIQEGSLVNYIDDFAIPAETLEELKERTIKFLKIADKNNLCFKRTKCKFNATQISLLGTVIGNGMVSMEKEKVESVLNWKIPTCIKDVEKFLGFANFYRRFIKNFSTLAAPLNALKKGLRLWKWEPEQQAAFESIKKAITSEPGLALPDNIGQFKLKADTSNIGIGAVLSQEQQGKWHPIAFMLKTLTDAK